MSLKVSVEENLAVSSNSKTTDVEPTLMEHDDDTITLTEDQMLSTNTEISTTALPPLPFSAKIWAWALLCSCTILLILIAVICILTRCYKRSERLTGIKSDTEFPTLAPKGREEISLLGKEPRSCQKQSEHMSVSTSCDLPTEQSFGNNCEENKESAVSLQRIEETNLHDELEVKHDSPDEVNSPNRIYKTWASQTPFKNEMALEAICSVRYIDSSLSSEESVWQALTTENTPEHSRHFRATITPLLTKKTGVSPFDKIGNKVVFLDTMTKIADTINKDASTSLQEVAQEVIDMQKHYLIRKASEPPKVPPKTK